MSAKEYKNSFFDAVLSLLWQHWSLLGVPGQISAKENEFVLDPEALLLFSTEYARYDQRLYDQILDWLQMHSSLINIQRLKALNTKCKFKNTASLGYMAAVVAETEPTRWAKPAKDYAVEQPTIPLFKDQNDKMESFIPKVDALAKSYSFLRNTRINTGKTPQNLPNGTASLLLRMRGLFGISARAETILVLLNSMPCKVQDIVERSGFAWKSIQDVLEELKASGFVASASETKRGKQYYLTTPDKIRHLFDIHTCVFPNWTTFYDVLGELWQLISNPRLALVSDETISNEIRMLYQNKLQGKLILSGYQPFFMGDLEKLLGAFPFPITY
ncbi:MAG: hypothetical protein IJS08_11365 [Victivallales bacterium]|nr:hypothetical protein [Victivallales bacterium]